MKNFITGLRVVLPMMDVMRQMMEDRGLFCTVNIAEGQEIGCRWERSGFRMELKLSLADTEIAWLWLWDDANDSIVVEARHENGRPYWRFDRENVPDDSPLAAIANDVCAQCVIHPDDGTIRDDVNAYEVVGMMVSFFLQHGGIS